METHLAHLFNVSQLTVRRICITWINFMYVQFGLINIWPSRDVTDKTVPEDFKVAYPSQKSYLIAQRCDVKCPVKGKRVKSATSQLRPIRPALISGFCSMKRLLVFLLPPGWDASPSQGYPQH